MTLRFGIFDHLERRSDVPVDEQYRDRLELLAQADRDGIYGYHIACRSRRRCGCSRR